MYAFLLMKAISPSSLVVSFFSSLLPLIKGICYQYQIGDRDLLIANLLFSVLSPSSFPILSTMHTVCCRSSLKALQARYDQKRGRLAAGRPWRVSIAVVGVGCRELPSPDAHHYLCEPTAAALPTLLAPGAWVDGGEELQRTCCLAPAEERCSLLLFALTAIKIPPPRLPDHVISAETD